MDKFTEDLFDEKKVKKAIKKGKRKTMMMVIFVTVLVFIAFNIANFSASFYFSQKAFKQWDAYIRLSTPNGYISETVDTKGFLGGVSHYKVSKDMRIKSIVVEQDQYTFGMKALSFISKGSGSNIGYTGSDWQFTYKENGWRNLLFFHPEITYKKYKNDENLINQMDKNQIYEVALSFDKPYKLEDLPFEEFPAMTWFWVNTYSDSQLKILQQEAREDDWSSTFIREDEALGFSINSSTDKLDQEYNNFLNLLQTSVSQEHRKTYDKMKEIDSADIEILGMVVYGTKDELAGIIKKPIIKASSLGGVIENY